MSQRLSITLMILLPFFTALGCGRQPYYDLKVMNRTGERCSEIGIDFGPRSAQSPRNVVSFPGNVVNGNASVADCFGDPAPTQATVRWTTESGLRFTQAVNLKPMRGAALRDVSYVFILRHDGTVRAAPLTSAERLEFQDDKLGCDDRPVYCVGVKNLTNGKLTGVTVRFGRYQVNAGEEIAPAGSENRGNLGWSFSHCLPYPLADTALVQWTTSDGLPHNEHVALEPLLPKSMDGICICFLLGNAGPVGVRAVQFKELITGAYPDLHSGWQSILTRPAKGK
jgi:hypothetical protein